VTVHYVDSFNRSGKLVSGEPGRVATRLSPAPAGTACSGQRLPRGRRLTSLNLQTCLGHWRSHRQRYAKRAAVAIRIRTAAIAARHGDPA